MARAAACRELNEMQDADHHDMLAAVAEVSDVDNVSVRLAEDVIVPARVSETEPGRVQRAVRAIVQQEHRSMSAVQLLAVEPRTFRVVRTLDDGVLEGVEENGVEMIDITPVP